MDETLVVRNDNGDTVDVEHDGGVVFLSVHNDQGDGIIVKLTPRETREVGMALINKAAEAALHRVLVAEGLKGVIPDGVYAQPAAERPVGQGGGGCHS